MSGQTGKPKALVLEDAFAYKDNIYFNDDWVVCRKGCSYYALRKGWLEPICLGVCPAPKPELASCRACAQPSHDCFDMSVRGTGPPRQDEWFSRTVPSDSLPFVKRRLAVASPPTDNHELCRIAYRPEEWPSCLHIFVEHHWKSFGARSSI